MPGLKTIYADLAVSPPVECSLEDHLKATWKNHSLIHWFTEPALRELHARGKSFSKADADAYIHNRFYKVEVWSHWTSKNWQIPFAALALYLIHIPACKFMVAKHGKWNVRNVAFYWNSFLSIFSWVGCFICVPALCTALWTEGLYFTACAPPEWYGQGLCGIAVIFFIYSKLAELFDTTLLLLSRRPVIALQWWHHSTVLLYCWHSFSAQISTGIWFAAMNYSVHSVMYGYFALASTSYRRYITPYAILITLAQLMQMLVGIFVTVIAVKYQMAGQECHVNRTNSVLGLLMYASYFVLFGGLFMENYVWGTKRTGSAGAERLSAKHDKAAPLPGKQTSVIDIIKAVSGDLSTPQLRKSGSVHQVQLEQQEAPEIRERHPTILGSASTFVHKGSGEMKKSK